MIGLDKKHLSYYILIFLLMLLGLVASLFFSPDKQTQTIFIIFTGIVYIFSGILHHFLEHDINLKVVVEYILIGGLGISLMMFLLKGSF